MKRVFAAPKWRGRHLDPSRSSSLPSPPLPWSATEAATRHHGGVPPIVLLVEDDASIRLPIAEILRSEGYEVVEADSGEAALAAFDRSGSDCVLVDLMLPGIDGFEVTRTLRQRSQVPIIIVTAKDSAFDVVAGLAAGADDYVTKPFEPKVLVARIRAALRRARSAPTSDVVRLGRRVEVRADEGVVRVEDEEVSLTRTEFRLLCELAASVGKVLSQRGRPTTNLAPPARPAPRFGVGLRLLRGDQAGRRPRASAPGQDRGGSRCP